MQLPIRKTEVFNSNRQNKENIDCNQDTEVELRHPKIQKSLLNIQLLPLRIEAKYVIENPLNQNQDISNHNQTIEKYNDKILDQKDLNINDCQVDRKIIEQSKKKKKLNRKKNRNEQTQSDELSQKPFILPYQQTKLGINPYINLKNKNQNLVSIKEISDVNFLLENPIPKGTKLNCTIKKVKISCMKPICYYMYLTSDNSIHLLSAKKLSWKIFSNYIISSHSQNFDDQNILAKVESNFLGTQFKILEYNNQNKHNTELVTVNYKFEGCSKEIKPRTMKVSLHSNANKDNKIETNIKNLNQQFLLNKQPIWDQNKKNYTMKFNKNVKCSSAKNFILINEFQQDILIFGKVMKGVFNMDITYPLSPIQAFGIALSSCDSKLIIQ